MTNVAVMGAGSWGTAFAKVLADAGSQVRLWGRRDEVVDSVNDRHENTDYLPGIPLPASLSATTDPGEALEDAGIVVLATPSQTLRDNLGMWTPQLASGSTLVSLMKGIELGSTLRMSEVISDVTGLGAERVAVLSGPNLAREIAEQQPAATVIACPDHDRAIALQSACQTGYFRPYTSTDVVGCELGGAVKNVIALACGIAEGMGFGDNTKASLITRGLAETARLGHALGADVATFAGLAGLGDLAATCTSPLSRNRTFGERLGRGETLEEAQSHTRQVTEGVKSCRSIRDLARKQGVEMPITDAIVAICHEGRSAVDVVPELMGRAPKKEAL
ncbi:NAD(P)H-dependent glycerol-3-phosphate dehydrogenase [Epidermidibacterium keratini]|uniref:Glycerol-3-phosphate dehydrogenase [NAD(P)+] n=1 Tax=Epidermidibacterium keratini TaxID=1891644 RepID=A0A7L4YRC8_9ACTN|nr:NAD(P)H-dependent glycerol-3-phosphate dehydrogenase [Epidermidibacterium keratini]QHC01801.1 NAD(P)H-dependent glycerol-3-phosphate dehydrogenase [Epidermidibacterium keratini]